MTAEKTGLYKNYNAWESDVVSYLKACIENGRNPRESYYKALELLTHSEVIQPLPQGVVGAGELANPNRGINNLMREMGYGMIVEGPRAR